MVQVYNSTFINWLFVKCMRHKQLCGRSLYWLASAPCCVVLPQWQASGRKILPSWLNVCLMKMDLVIIIKLQEFKCYTIKQHLRYLWQAMLFPRVEPDASIAEAIYILTPWHLRTVCPPMMNNLCITLNARCGFKYHHRILKSIMGNAYACTRLK